MDVRDEAQITKAVEAAVAKFGGIDILVNNASAIQLTGTLQTDMKRYDLMHSINTRGTFLVFVDPPSPNSFKYNAISGPKYACRI